VRICFFNRSYYPDLGATGQLLTELAEDLVRACGHEVWVVAGPPLYSAGGKGRRGAPWWKPSARELHNGVQIVRVWGTTLRPRSFAGRAANYLSYFLGACVAALRVPRPDIVVTLTDPPIIGLAALLAARRSDARFVFMCQDIFPEVARLLDEFRSKVLDLLLDRINRFLLRAADRVVALGETMRERLVGEKGAHPGKVVIIHNWADCEAIVPGPKENPFSLAHGLAERFVVMHSGNMGLAQGLDMLLDAAERLRDCPDLVIALVGNGAKREALLDRVRTQRLSNVRLFPYQAKEQLKESFASADVFIVSLRRGLAGYIVPSKLYGILAAGRPYVAAVEEASEVAAITKKYQCGLLAEPESAGDLAEKILILYRDRQFAEHLGANARRAALDFDRARQVREYESLFRELVGGPAGASRQRAPLLKYLLDVLLSGAGLLLSGPLWLVISLAIKLEDRGPVFYFQERVGKDGQRFLSWKFRSMIVDADQKYGPLQAAARDARVTRVGRILRATALDELPQLWNIFKGEMSFVGPRAMMPREIEIGGSGEAVSIEAIPGF